MKVLIINAVYGSGSTGVITRDIQSNCLENGIDAYVAFPRGCGPRNEKTYEIGCKADRKLHALLCRIAGQQAYFSHIPTWNLIRYIKRLKPDVVNLHNLHNNYLNIGILFKYLAQNDIPTVLSLHDCWFFTGGCFHYTSTGCMKWQAACGHCPRRTKDTPALLYDASARILEDRARWLNSIRHLTVAGVSNWVTEECRKSRIHASRFMFIHNGVDTELFRQTPSDFRERLGLEGKYVILAPASKWLLPINRPTYQYFVDHLPVDTVLLLFGGNKDIPVNSPRVRSYGFTRDRVELAQLYTMADVMINTSREDTFPLLNIECQACGTPVITYDATGLKETVDGVCGFAIETGNYEALFDTYTRFRAVQSPEHSTACRERVLKYFEKKENYRKYVELFAGMAQEDTTSAI